MSIITFEGKQGSGKTNSAVALAYTEMLVSHKKVISNNHLNFPYEHFDIEFFLEHLEDQQLENCILLLDEAYLYLDSRSSSSKLNKLFTYFVVQTRKRGVDLYVCTHHIDVLDKRLRRAVDVRGTCRFRKEKPCSACLGKGTGKGEDGKCPRCLGYGVTGWATIRFLDMRTGSRRRIRIFGPAFWGFFSTGERIPFQRRQVEIEV